MLITSWFSRFCFLPVCSHSWITSFFLYNVDSPIVQLIIFLDSVVTLLPCFHPRIQLFCCNLMVQNQLTRFLASVLTVLLGLHSFHVGNLMVPLVLFLACFVTLLLITQLRNVSNLIVQLVLFLCFVLSSLASIFFLQSKLFYIYNFISEFYINKG